MKNKTGFAFSCPISTQQYPQVLLAHGGGGKLMHQLIEKMFLPLFNNSFLDGRHDGAVMNAGGAKLAFTTDSYVVRPLFFSGGDIGTLAINGTVNDLAMCGARPLYLSAGLILEEGLPMDTLWRVVRSMKQAAEEAGVQLVTGDTKVVDKGKGDGIFINTAGIGLIEHGLTIAPVSVRPGDAVLLSGDLGRHGMAIMATREGIALESEIESDCAPVAGLVREMLDTGIEIHCLRDLTRGGLSSALVEIAEARALSIHVEEKAIPVREDVKSVCEILGLDPFYVANEGRFVAFVPESQAERALAQLRSHELARHATIIGRVGKGPAGRVVMKTCLGTERVVDMLSGEQLPRIC